MKFTLRNLGRLSEATVDLDKDLILLTGPNNTSKTYVAHAIYGLCKHYAGTSPAETMHALDEFIKSKPDPEHLSIDLIEFVETHLDRILESLTTSYQREIASVFATTQDFVARTEVELTISRNQMSDGIRRLRELSIDKELQYGRRTAPIFIRKSAGNSVWAFERGARLAAAREEPDGEDATSPILMASRSEAVLAIHFAFFKRLGSPFILTAERSAVQLFSRELSLRRTELVDDLLGMIRNGGSRGSQAGDLAEALERRAKRYPLAIHDSLLSANDAATWRKRSSPFRAIADRMDRDVLRGTIHVDEDGGVAFQPTPEGPGLTLHLASSSVKSLAGLSLFLRHIGQMDDFLIIDEPELNLHPDNQRRVARVLARLARAGVKVLISTHSDYVIRELNNLIMLSADSSGDLRRRHGYEEEETLSPAKVGAYLFDGRRANPIDVAPTGVEVETIDREINALNAASQDIYFSLFGKTDA
ncbi:AAA family ATPase [Sorangium sp. So ce118]